MISYYIGLIHPARYSFVRDIDLKDIQTCISIKDCLMMNTYSGALKIRDYLISIIKENDFAYGSVEIWKLVESEGNTSVYCISTVNIEVPAFKLDR